jgi:deazaflavin-dependent oxidoreductase (nitroreductase family)
MIPWQKTLEALKERSTCRITTRGRKSGRPHTVTIWFVVGDGGAIHLGTLKLGRDWPKNVAANPAVVIEIDGLRLRGDARRLTDDASVRDVASRIARKYWAAWIGSWFGLKPEGVFEVTISGEAS